MNDEQLFAEIIRIETLISNGPIDELIAYAKEYNIHQVSNSTRYTEQVNKIKNRLVAEGIDPETIRK
jgi:hypothetical protein